MEFAKHLQNVYIEDIDGYLKIVHLKIERKAYLV